MNKIEKLIAELCPEGVQYVALNQLGRRNGGTNITASRMKKIRTESGDTVRIFAGGKTIADIPKGLIPEKDVVNDQSIIIGARGNIVITRYDKPFSHKREIWSYTMTNEEAELSFVYYYLLSKVELMQKIAKANSVKLPQLKTTDTDLMKIPLPPLSIQQEIVSILDTFTELEKELEKELEARQTEYVYYRNALLRLDGNSGLPEIDEMVKRLCPEGASKEKLGELLDYEQPIKYLVKSKKYDNSFQTPVLTAGKTFILGYTEETKDVFHAGKDTPVIIFDDFTTAFKWVDFPFKAKSSAMKMLRSKDQTKANLRFVYYMMFGINPKIMEHSRQWIQKYSNIKIPLPPLPIQQKIVEILDSFDSLVHDLSIGLPAEIKARKNQYEYYRNQLLTFKEKPSEPSS